MFEIHFPQFFFYISIVCKRIGCFNPFVQDCCCMNVKSVWTICFCFCQSEQFAFVRKQNDFLLTQASKKFISKFIFTFATKISFFIFIWTFPSFSSFCSKYIWRITLRKLLQLLYQDWCKIKEEYFVFVLQTLLYCKFIRPSTFNIIIN